MECVEQTREPSKRIAQQDYDGAILLRGGSFSESEVILSTMQQAAPRPPRMGADGSGLPYYTAADQRRA